MLYYLCFFFFLNRVHSQSTVGNCSRVFVFVRFSFCKKNLPCNESKLKRTRGTRFVYRCVIALSFMISVTWDYKTLIFLKHVRCFFLTFVKNWKKRSYIYSCGLHCISEMYLCNPHGLWLAYSYFYTVFNFSVAI